MYDLQEQEQLDELKAWWKQYGRMVTTVVLAACVAAGATVGWQFYKRNQAEHASQLYGTLEALAAAKANYEAGEATSAAAQLQWTVDHARDEDIVAAARLRLAGVLLDQKKYDEALKLLEAAHPEAFNGLFADLKGDVLVAQGKTAEARAAYQQALDKLPAEGTYRAIVQVKLDGLGADK